MKLRAKLLLTTAAGALLMGVTSGTQVMAADAMVVKAAPAPAGWWYQGYIEVGARFYGPQHTGGATPGGANLAKFNEYRDLRPGPFGNIFMATGSNDGMYVVDFWAKNIGYDDQSYYLNFSKAGEHYVTLGWDETPHNYSSSVATIYNGAGTNNLTIPNSTRTAIAAGWTATAAPNNPGAVANAIASNSNTFALGFRRDTASVDYRWTPTPNWDVRVDYSHLHREGTQPQAAITYRDTPPGAVPPALGAANRVVTELPKPVNDTTHNGNVSAEYAGISPWGKKFNVNLAYGFSIYQDANDVVNFQNPFVVDGANTMASPLNNVLSLPPSNNANIFSLNGGADLPSPWKTRDTFAVQYTTMEQDTAFSNYGGSLSPFTVNNDAFNALVIAGLAPTISAASLNANNSTTLINNVLTTQFRQDLKGTLRYRFYDTNSSANAVAINRFLPGDSTRTVATPAGGVPIGNYMAMTYQKQNASGDLVWNPLGWLTVGTVGGWERWDHDNRDVNVTNEFFGKVFADAKAWDWSLMRSSFLYSERRFDNYGPSTVDANSSGWRLFDLANRNRAKGTFLWDFYAPYNFTITPTGGFRWDDYGTNPLVVPGGAGFGVSELGLLQDHKWNAGLEVSWGFARNMSLFASYVHEEGWREQMQGSQTSPINNQIADRVDTFMVGTNVVLVPERLSIKASYTYVQAFSSLASHSGPVGTAITSLNQAGTLPVPDSRANFNRVDVVGKYQFDPDWVHSMGWKGEVYATLRYLWESNSVVDPSLISSQYLYSQTASMGFTGGNLQQTQRSIFLGWDNPNYNVQLIAASVGFKW